MVLSTQKFSARQTRTAPDVPPHAGGDLQRRPVNASRNEKEMSEHPGWGRGGERRRTWNTSRKKRDMGAARLAWCAEGGREMGKEKDGCGAWAQRKREGGGERKGRMRRANAKKGADAARASKREHGGAVTKIEWCCERPDRAARWRDDERERRPRRFKVALLDMKVPVALNEWDESFPIPAIVSLAVAAAGGGNSNWEARPHRQLVRRMQERLPRGSSSLCRHRAVYPSPPADSG